MLELVLKRICIKLLKIKKHYRAFGSGPLLIETIEANKLLKKWGIESSVWSKIYSELRKEAEDVDRWNMRHPEQESKLSYIQKASKHKQPNCCSNRLYKMVSEQIRPS